MSKEFPKFNQPVSPEEWGKISKEFLDLNQPDLVSPEEGGKISEEGGKISEVEQPKEKGESPLESKKKTSEIVLSTFKQSNILKNFLEGGLPSFARGIFEDSNKALERWSEKKEKVWREVKRAARTVADLGPVLLIVAGQALAATGERHGSSELPGFDNFSRDLTHISMETHNIWQEATKANNFKTLGGDYIKLQKLVGYEEYKGPYEKLTAERLLKAAGEEKWNNKQEAQRVTAESRGMLREIENKAFQTLLAENPDIAKFTTGEKLTGIAAKDCERLNLNPTAENFLQLCFKRSLNVVRGLSYYLELPENTSGIKPENLTPEIQGFMVKYLTYFGFESGRVGSVKGLPGKVYDKIYDDWLKYQGKSQSDFSPKEKTAYEAKKAKTLEGIDSAFDLYKKFPGYKPAPGNIELVLFTIIEMGAKEPEKIQDLISLPAKGLEKLPPPVKTAMEELKLVKEPEAPFKGEVRISSKAIQQFFGGLEKIDYNKLGNEFYKTFKFESLREILGGTVHSVEEFWGDGNINKFEFTNTEGKTAAWEGAPIKITDLIKNPYDFEQFLRNNKIPDKASLNVNIGGQEWKIQVDHTYKREGENKESLLNLTLTRSDGTGIRFEGMHTSKAFAARITEEVGSMKSLLGGGAFSTGETKYYINHETGEICHGGFDWQLEIPGEKGELSKTLRLQGADINFMSKFIKVNKETPMSSEVRLYDNSVIKLGDVFKNSWNTWRFYKTALANLEQGEFKAGFNLEGKYAGGGEFTKSELQKGWFTKPGLEVEIKGAKVERGGKLRGALEIKSIALSAEGLGLGFYSGNNRFELQSNDSGTFCRWVDDAGEELISFKTPITRSEILNNEGAFKEIQDAARVFGKNVKEFAGKGITKGNIKTEFRNSWREFLDKTLNNLPGETELTVNLPGILGKFVTLGEGAEAEKFFPHPSRGMEKEGGGIITFTTEDLKTIDSLTKEGNRIFKIEPGSEKDAAKRELYKKIADFSVDRVTGEKYKNFQEYVNTMAGYLSLMDANEIMETGKGLVAELDYKTAGPVLKSMFGASYTQLDGNAKLYLAAHLARLGIDVFGNPAETGQVFVKTTALELKAGTELKILDKDLEISLGALGIVRVPVSGLDISLNRVTSFNLGKVDINGEIIPSGIVYLRAEKGVGDNIKLSAAVVLSPNVKEVFPFKPGVGVGGEFKIVAGEKGPVKVEAGVKIPMVAHPEYSEANVGVKIVDPLAGGELRLDWRQLFYLRQPVFGVGYELPVGNTNVRVGAYQGPGGLSFEAGVTFRF